eukprot:1447279-Pyramimonas_sp.AAC.1
MRKTPLGPSVELPMGERNAALSGSDTCEHHRWAFGGAPYGSTKRCIGPGGRIRTPPLGPSLGLPMRPRSAVLGGEA